MAQLIYAGTNDRDGNVLNEFRTFRRGLRQHQDQLDPQARQVFDVLRKYAAEVRRGDGLPSGRYESFLADLEKESKLILAHHLGHRTAVDTSFFIGKLDRATKGGFQLSTDGLDSYADTVVHQLGTRVQYGQIIET